MNKIDKIKWKYRWLHFKNFMNLIMWIILWIATLSYMIMFFYTDNLVYGITAIIFMIISYKK